MAASCRGLRLTERRRSPNVPLCYKPSLVLLVALALVLIVVPNVAWASPAANICPGDSTPYDTSILATPAYSGVSKGVWGSYYPRYPIAGSNTDKTPAATAVHFDRLDQQINMSLTSEGGAAIFQPDTDLVLSTSTVPKWRDFGAAAYEFNVATVAPGGWFNSLFIRWTFRLVAPCTGDYILEMEADGVCFHVTRRHLAVNTL